MIRCRDGTLYTGATTDVDRRFAEHQQAGPKAARYLKGRGPLQLILTVHAGGHKAALKLERRIKGLPKARKEVLIQNPESMQEIFGVFGEDSARAKLTDTSKRIPDLHKNEVSPEAPHCQLF